MPRPDADGQRGGAPLPPYMRRRSFADQPWVRFAARASAVLFLAFALLHSLGRAGQFADPQSPFHNLDGRLAGLIGQQVGEVRVEGLTHHRPESVLKAIGIRAGGPMIGFDPHRARRLLENLAWVKTARLTKLYPNRLHIRIVERQPIALWQTDGEFYPIDADGVALPSLPAARFARLPLVTGAGANRRAAALINHLEAWPALRSRLKAAARVGERRWNLYFDSGLKVMLPAADVAAALKTLAALQARQQVLDKAIETLDLRLPARMALRPEAPDRG